MDDAQKRNLESILNSTPTPSNYNEAKHSSILIDERLGFQIEATEKVIQERENSTGKTFQTWSNLSPQAFQTPYSELVELVKRLNPPGDSKTWVDLGAAYGRLAFVLAVHAPNSRHLGYEIASERVREGNRVAALHGIDRSVILEEDLSRVDFQPETADIYFIYDYGKSEAVRKTLEDLRAIAAKRRIQVIARGLGIQNEIDRRAPWLHVFPPERLPHSTIYRS